MSFKIGDYRLPHRSDGARPEPAPSDPSSLDHSRLPSTSDGNRPAPGERTHRVPRGVEIAERKAEEERQRDTAGQEHSSGILARVEDGKVVRGYSSA